MRIHFNRLVVLVSCLVGCHVLITLITRLNTSLDVEPATVLLSDTNERIIVSPEKKVHFTLRLMPIKSPGKGLIVEGDGRILFDREKVDPSLSAAAAEAAPAPGLPPSSTPAPLRYAPAFNSSLVGATLTVSSDILSAMRFPLLDFVELNNDSVEDFVFATAADQRYLAIALEAIATIQKHFPTYRIIFYDLGRRALDGKLISLIERLCRVEYRKFHFEQFPTHVKDLQTYAWKPLIVHELLQEYPGVFWVDSSIRFVSGQVRFMLKKTLASSGVLLFNSAGHNTFSVTHRGMYRYLPTDVSGIQRALQREANCMLLYKTAPVYNDVIKWWVLCALDRKCIAPTRQLACHFTNADAYAGCHRFDQSAINILLGNKHNFDVDRYVYLGPQIETVERYSVGKFSPRVCESHSQVN